jgi:hypothetical protein
MRKIMSAVVVVIAVSIVNNGAAHAGGWAVVALDPSPGVPVEGQPFTVGFTILQHGVSPYTTPNAAVVVTDAAGRSERFAAKPDGAPGHHVAIVTFSAPGTHRWAITPDWFAPQPLGDIEVTPASGAASVSTTREAAPTTSVTAPTPLVTAPTPLATALTTTHTTREPIALALRVVLGLVTVIALGATAFELRSMRRRTAVS